MKLPVRTKLFPKIFWRFILAAILPLAMYELLTYYNFYSEIRNNIQNALIATSEGRAEALKINLNSFKNYTTEKSNSQAPRAAFEAFNAAYQNYGLKSDRYQQLTEKYRLSFQRYFDAMPDLHNMLIISKAGIILFSMRDDNEMGLNIVSTDFQGSILTDLFKSVSMTLSTSFSEFDIYTQTGQPGLFIGAPVFEHNTIQGVLVFQLNPDLLASFAQNYYGLPSTGDISFGKLTSVSDEVMFVVPLRFDSAAAFTRKVRGNQVPRPIWHAVHGETGIGITMDERQNETLARWQLIPQLNLGMVVKVDTQEAFRPIRNLRNMTLILGVLMIGVIIVIARSLTTSITQPILAFKEASERIKHGDYGIQVEVTETNEIRDMAHAFNAMSRQLSDFHQQFERRIAEKTQELAITLQESEETKKAILNLMDDVERTNHELQTLNRGLLSANEDLSNFAYVASHDLQEPLRTITSFSQIIAEDYKGKLSQEADEYITFIIDATSRMKALIVDLLQFSRIGRDPKVHTEVSLEKVLETVEQDLCILIAQEKATITHTPLPNLLVNQNQMFQLFQNLISNAIKYRKPNHDPVIQINVEPEAENWHFSISDNGIGIPEGAEKRIFTIFQRLHTRQQYSGTGIGLAVCKKIVENHNGRIWVTSQLEVGSIFHFTLPKK